MDGASAIRGTPKELRKLRDQSMSEDDPAVESSPTTTSPARLLPEGLKEDRLFYWQHMSQIIRIQGWWKRLVARRVIHEKAVRRRFEIAHMVEDESAQAIQNAWRTFHARSAHS